MIGAGIDAGSRAVKVVLYDSDTGAVLASGVEDQTVDQEGVAQALFDHLLETSEIERVRVERIIATGYARGILGFADTTVTEITCHGIGVQCLCPEAATVIEIGGQDSKVLLLGAEGEVRDFVMNDRCAAGTGRFIEVVATRIGTALIDLSALLELADDPAPISSTCVVFAETEIVGLMAKKVTPANILAGVEHSIANRIASMAGRLVEPPVVFTGGVAMVPGMAEALERELGVPVSLVPTPQFTGALGAAILACR
ncbi:MAG: acyl-CoA dehydratase activase [Planctomycetota bacterium]|jgi:predicted CoA-substrate-specific enzyme activase